MSDQNLIEFPGAAGDAVPVPRAAGLKCFHRLHCKTVDPDRRQVTCAGCQEHLDPMDVLISIAQDHERKAASLKHLNAKIDETHQKLSALKSEEKKAKARIGNARKKDAVHEERKRILEQMDEALQRFSDQEALTLDYARASGTLRGFKEVVGGLFYDPEHKTDCERLRRKIEAGIEELEARRKRRGDKKSQRKRPPKLSVIKPSQGAPESGGA